MSDATCFRFECGNSIKMLVKAIYVFYLMEILQVSAAILELGERPKFTSDYCPEVKIHCLCGSPNNTIIETFTVSRKLEISLNSIHEECSKIPLPVDVCLSHSCSVLLPPYTSPDLSAFFKMRRSVKIIHNYPFKLFLQPDNELDLYDLDLGNSIETSKLIAKKKRRSIDDTVEDILKSESTSDYGENNFDPSKSLKSGTFPVKCDEAIKPLKNTFISCSFWPETVSCEFNCTYGYAIMEGGKLRPRTKRVCHEQDNMWSPFNSFPVCKPHINCKTTLTRPGSMLCKSSTSKPAYCDISCNANAVYDEILETRYTCYNKTYSLSLPHCASVDKNASILHNLKHHKVKKIQD